VKDLALYNFLHEKLRDYDVSEYGIDAFGKDLEAFLASQWRPVSEPPEMENRRNLLVESLDVLGCDTQKHQWVVRAWIDPEDGSVRWSGSPHALTHWRPLPEGPKP
jgi:hypothetical protein